MKSGSLSKSKTLGQDSRKKQQEVLFFRFAQQQFPGLLPSSTSEDLSGERPDIVVTTGTEVYGVEVTEIVDESARAHESRRRKVCSLAQKHSAIGDGINVAVLFKPGALLGSSTVRLQVATRLADLVRSHVDAQGNVQWQQRIDCYGTPLDPYITTVFLHYMPNWPASRWYPAMAWGVPPLTSQRVGEAIQPKEVRLPDYLLRASKVVLLVVVEGFSGSASMYFTEEAIQNTYHTDFDAVLLLDFGNHKAHRLNISPVSSQS